jgi:AcrR family transcriptional regulator
VTADETRTALVEALRELLRDRPAGAISVREIAARAGVNHGLVHRYFGSKEALVREAVSRIAAQVHSARPPEAGLSAWSYQLFRAHPDLPVIVARCCLDGPLEELALAAPPPVQLERIVAPIRALFDRTGIPVDGHVANALGTAALLGWFVFRPLLDRGYGLPADADEQALRLFTLLDAALLANGTRRA